tara:strand:+ start:900 stop:3191 length:2292 start_codon:yes stop_codon:yes gene_type:complete
MLINDLLCDIQAKSNGDKIYRGINVLIKDDGGKEPVGEKNNLPLDKLNNTPQNLNFGNCFSTYVKYVENLYVIDFDTKEKLEECPLYKILMLDGVYHNDSFRFKGFHFWVFIDNLPKFTNQIKVSIDDRWEIDLMKTTNIWDRKNSEVWGKDYGYYDWNTIKQYFNENRMNIQTDIASPLTKELPLEKITTNEVYSSDDDASSVFSFDDFPRCDSTQFMDYITRLGDQRYLYDSWLSVGVMCYNNFVDTDEGYDIWREWSKNDPNYDKTKMSNREMFLKYETFDETRHKKLSYKTLRQWANSDNPLNPFELAFENGGIDKLVETMNKYCIYVRDIGIFIILHNENWYLKKNGEANDYFEKYTFNTFNSAGKPQPKNVFNLWKKNTKRREVDKIVYDPSNSQENVFNLWKGYKITYDDVKDYDGECKFLLDHILNVWCNGDEEHYNYVLNWLAFKLQYPAKKIGVVIALRSQEGAGKGLVFKIIAKIIGKNHYCSISNINSLIGDFNGLSEGRQLIDLDEAVWGGNKLMEGRLKSIITEEEQVINKKNKEQYVIDNYCDFFMTTNEDWFAPVNRNSRRYFCLEMNNKIAGFNLSDDSRSYIKELMKSDEMAFAKHLYERDVSKFNPRQFVKTKLLQDQVEQNWNSIEAFWHDKLIEQSIDNEVWMSPHDLCVLNDGTPYYSKTHIFQKYKEWDGGSYSRKVGNVKFWKQSCEIFNIDSSLRLATGRREYYIQMPLIQEARQLFNNYQKYDYTYPDVVDFINDDD